MRHSFDTFKETAASVMGNADFRLIWYVGSLAEFGRRFELLVLVWLILQVTDGYFQLGLMVVFNNIVRPFVSPFAGYIADRFSRRNVLLAAQGMNIATGAALLAYMSYDISLLQPWHVFGAVFIYGLTKAIEDPSRRTAIMDIVGRRRLVNAVSLDVISQNAGKMLGPVVAGILLDLTGFSGAYSFLIAVHLFNWLLMAFLRIPESTVRTAMEPVLRSLGSAVRYTWSSPMMLGLLYVTFVMNALAFPVQQFIPALGKDHLDVGVVLVGLLVAADGFGNLAGAGMISLARNVRFHGRFYTFGSLIVLVMAIAYAWSPWYVATFTLLVLSGLGQSGFSTMQTSITLLAAPEEMRGRMMGLLSTCIGVANPIGALEIGAIASLFALHWSISLNAAAGLVLVLPAIALTPLVRQPLTQPPPAPVTP